MIFVSFVVRSYFLIVAIAYSEIFMAELYPYPRFSLAERDRRWQAVRELMRQQNLDVIVTPQNSGHSADYQANTRYLTHCGGGEPDLAAVFPIDGAVTAIATSAGRAGRRCRIGSPTCARRGAITAR